MIRCPDCGAMLDSMSELARHVCEPEEKKPATNLDKAWEEFDAK